MEVPAKGNVLGLCVPARYVFAVLGSIGMAIVYGLKVNLSVAMVAMLNHTALAKRTFQRKEQFFLDREPECEASFNGGEDPLEERDGPFIWSAQKQGIILSCYFWGYLVGQIPGGRLAEMYSAKWVMFAGVALNILGTLLTPVAAYGHYSILIVVRIFEGLGAAVSFPSMHVLLSRWGPKEERSLMGSLVYAGTSLGTVNSLLMSGMLAEHIGWESIFYVMGCASIIWGLLWILLVQDSPLLQPYITSEERKMIVDSVGDEVDEGNHEKSPVPWKQIFTSRPFLAIVVAHICSNWGWYMMLIEMPFYMKQVLKYSVAENGVLTAIPFLTLWLFSIILSKALDTIRVKGIINMTQARKIATFIASAIPAVCLLGLCYIGCRRKAAVVLLTLGVTCMGGIFCGFLTNHIDLAPRYAGTLMALTNTVATFSGIVVPMFVGHITDGDPTITAWRIVFFVTIGFFVIEVLVYTLFASGKEQSWNKTPAEIAIENRHLDK